MLPAAGHASGRLGRHHARASAQVEGEVWPEGGGQSNDERWMVVDTLPPFDPRDMEAVR